MGFSLKNSLAGGLISGLFGGDDDESGIARPTYYSDPNYTETQSALKDLGLGLISGQVPDYYKAIGETGSKEFENALGMTTRDIQKSAAESAAASGRSRGGNLAAVTAGAVADSATKMRYSDYERALSGKQSLLTTGINTTAGVRSSAQSEQSSRNQFNWTDYDAQVAERAYQDAKQEKEDAALGELIGTIATVGMGVATGGASGGIMALTGNQTFSNLFGGQKTAQQTAGVGSLGSIRSGDLAKSLIYG